MRSHRDPLRVRLGRGLKKLAKWTFGLVVLALVGLYGFVRYDYSSAAGELEEHIARAKELGLPLTPEDMRHAPLAPEDNAAPLYQLAAQKLEAGKKRFESREAITAQQATYLESPKDLGSCKELLKELDPILAEVVRGSERKGCDFERDWDLGPQLIFPEFAWMKGMVKWLSFRAVYRARTGEFDAALEDVQAASRVGALVSEDKVLISGLVRVACDAILMRAVNAIATFHERDSGRLGRLAGVVKSLAPTVEVEPFLRGEVFWGYWTSLNLDRYDRMHPREIDEAWGHSDLGFMGMGIERWRVFPPLIPVHMAEEAYASRSLEFWNEMMALYREKRWTSRELSTELDLRARRFHTSTRPCDAVGAVLFPVFAQAGTAFEKMEASRQSTLALIEALRYRNRVGHWPKDLGQIGFSIEDPYTGNPIRYRVNGGGFRIYSVYADGKDGGGKFGHEGVGNSDGRDFVLAAHPSWEMIALPPMVANQSPASNGPPPAPLVVPE